MIGFVVVFNSCVLLATLWMVWVIMQATHRLSALNEKLTCASELVATRLEAAVKALSENQKTASRVEKMTAEYEQERETLAPRVLAQQDYLVDAVEAILQDSNIESPKKPE